MSRLRTGSLAAFAVTALLIAGSSRDANAACLATTSCDMTAGDCEGTFTSSLIEGLMGGHQVDVTMACGGGMCGGTAIVEFRRANEPDSYQCVMVSSVSTVTCLQDPWGAINAAAVAAQISTGTGGATQVTDEVMLAVDCSAAVSVDVPSAVEPPDTEIVFGPADGSTTTATTETFTYTSYPPGSGFEVRIDGGAWTPIGVTSFTTDALTQAPHTFEVRATEGNLFDATPALIEWTIVAPPAPRLYFANTPSTLPGAQTMSSATIGAGGALSLATTNVATAGNASQRTGGTAVAASPDGSLVFLGHNESDLVQSFVVDGSGGLTAGHTIAVTQPTSIAVHPTLSAFYVVDLDRPSSRLWTIWYFPDGSMTTLGPSDAIADEARGIAVHPSGSHLVTSHIFGAFTGVQVYAIDANGALAFVSSQTITGGRVDDVTFDRTGNFVYVADLDQGIHAFQFESGLLTPINGGIPYSTGLFLYDFVASPTEDVLFAASASPAGVPLEPTEIRRFAIAPDGSLTLLGMDDVPDVCTEVAISLDGRTLAMTSRSRSRIRTFAVAPGTFGLSEAPGSPYAAANPLGVTPSNLVAID